MKLDTVRVDDSFTFIRERRSSHVFKSCVHRWYIYQGHEVFVKFRGKKDRTPEEMAVHQCVVDELKALFGLRQIGSRVVFDKVEGFGVMQKWWPNLGTLANGTNREKWFNEEGLFELLKIAVLDHVVGNTDRTKSNVLVLEDGSLLPIDEESVFYAHPERRGPWAQFHGELNQEMHGCYLRHRVKFEDYVQGLLQKVKEILEVADHPVMKRGNQYTFYDVLHLNATCLKVMAQLAIEQLKGYDS